LADLVAEGRLGDVQSISRAMEVQLFGHRHEIAQLAEFHDWPPDSGSRSIVSDQVLDTISGQA
jgi:hypothetical protein